MKSTATLKKDVSNWDTVAYPCMGICPEDNLIVLFQNKEKGTVINVGTNKAWEVGEQCNDFEMNEFIPAPKGTKVVLEA